MRQFENTDVSQIDKLLPKSYDGSKSNVICILRELLDPSQDLTRRDAVLALRRAAEKSPKDVQLTVSDLIPLLSDEHDGVKANTAWILGWIAKRYPEVVQPAVDDVRPLLLHEQEKVRNNAVWALTCVAEEYPQAVQHVVEDLRPLLLDEQEKVRNNATLVLARVAKDHPEAVQPVLTELADLLQDGNYSTRRKEIDTLVTVIKKYEPVTGDIGEQLTDGIVSENAAEVLTVLSSKHPDCVRKAVEANAPDQVTTIVGENNVQKFIRDDKYNKSTTLGYSSIKDETNFKIPKKIPNPPTVDITNLDICGHIKTSLNRRKLYTNGKHIGLYKQIVEINGQKVPLGIKTLLQGVTSVEEEIEQLHNEIDIWQKVGYHDYIVSVVDYRLGSYPFIAMEYMHGGHLGERAKEMKFNQKLWTAIAITQAIRHANRRGIVHLNLNPESILFRSVESAWDVPKVADWGRSKQLPVRSKNVEVIFPQYAAPEQFTDDFGEIDNITDVYQLGAVFYELMTGQPPFDSQQGILQQMEYKEPTPPSELTNTPPELDKILLRALATDKDDRYEDVLLFRNELQRVFDSL